MSDLYNLDSEGVEVDDGLIVDKWTGIYIK